MEYAAAAAGANPDRKKHLIRLGVILGAVLALVAAWRWTPLGEWLDTETLTGFFGYLKQSPLAPVLVIGAFLLGSLVAVPVSLLIVATLLVFGTTLGFIYALTGAELGALLTYAVGAWLGRDAVRSLAGSRIDALDRQLARQGVLAVAILRLTPIAPFTVINIMAGASRIRLRDFALGSLLGLTPGILLLAMFSDRLATAVQNPSPGQWLAVGVVIGVMILAGLGAQRWLLK